MMTRTATSALWLLLWLSEAGEAPPAGRQRGQSEQRMYVHDAGSATCSALEHQFWQLPLAPPPGGLGGGGGRWGSPSGTAGGTDGGGGLGGESSTGGTPPPPPPPPPLRSVSMKLTTAASGWPDVGGWCPMPAPITIVVSENLVAAARVAAFEMMLSLGSMKTRCGVAIGDAALMRWMRPECVVGRSAHERESLRQSSRIGRGGCGAPSFVQPQNVTAKRKVPSAEACERYVTVIAPPCE
jgi:hypothetical protein